MTRITCRKYPESAFVLCFTWFEVPSGDMTHLQAVPIMNMRIVFYTA